MGFFDFLKFWKKNKEVSKETKPPLGSKYSSSRESNTPSDLYYTRSVDISSSSNIPLGFVNGVIVGSIISDISSSSDSYSSSSSSGDW